MTEHQSVSSALHDSGFAFFRSYGERLRELGLFMLERRRHGGTVPVCTDTWWEESRRGSQALLSSVQWWSSEHIEMQETLFKLKLFFHCEGKWRSRFSERLWGLHLGDLWNPVPGHPVCSEQEAGLDDVQRCLPNLSPPMEKTNTAV